MKFHKNIRNRAASAGITTLLAAAVMLTGTSAAQAGIDEYIGEISLIAGSFCPNATMDCAGQLLPINQYQALFALIGTYYGGNGTTTFALPDLRGRVPIGVGQGPGLANYAQGQAAGTESETLTLSQLPVHTHTASFSQPASSAAATKGSPDSNIPAVAEKSIAAYTDAAANTAMRSGTVTVNAAGSGSAHNNMQPYLAMRYCINVQGIFPSRP